MVASLQTSEYPKRIRKGRTMQNQSFDELKLAAPIFRAVEQRRAKGMAEGQV
jgi:hypothetical protein